MASPGEDQLPPPPAPWLQQTPVVSEAQAGPGRPHPPGLQAQGFSGRRAEGKIYLSVNS